jgi:hypothetical protein
MIFTILTCEENLYECLDAKSVKKSTQGCGIGKINKKLMPLEKESEQSNLPNGTNENNFILKTYSKSATYVKNPR